MTLKNSSLNLNLDAHNNSDFANLKDDQAYNLLNQVSRKDNPTFKTELLKSTLLETLMKKRAEKLERSNYGSLQKKFDGVQELEIATKRFEQKNNPEVMRLKSAEKMHENSIKNYTKILQQSPLNNSSKKTQKQKSQNTILKLYLNNDEGVFVKQSKPFNIISNVPQEITDLRSHKKFTSEYKNVFNYGVDFEKKFQPSPRFH